MMYSFCLWCFYIVYLRERKKYVNNVLNDNSMVVNIKCCICVIEIGFK